MGEMQDGGKDKENGDGKLICVGPSLGRLRLALLHERDEKSTRIR